ncbi:hypothetical protein JCM8547_009064 [Rhodosporidiobolus lusitaniae]
MLGPLVKAQLVAAGTKLLLESKAFTGSVEALHRTVTKAQQSAYDSLLVATEDWDSKHPPPHLEQRAKAETYRPRQDEPLKDQNSELQKLLSKMREEMKDSEGRR